MTRARPFLVLWTLAVAASAAAFVLHLALRGQTVELGYELGRARAEQARLREAKRVLELQAASYETPQRVDLVAKTLLGMQPPSADRIIPMGGLPRSALVEPPTQSGTAPGKTSESAGFEPKKSSETAAVEAKTQHETAAAAARAEP